MTWILTQTKSRLEKCVSQESDETRLRFKFVVFHIGIGLGYLLGGDSSVQTV